MPHAKDFLIEFLDLESFKELPFGVTLDTSRKRNAEIFLEKAGFKVLDVYGCQNIRCQSFILAES